MDNGGGGSVLRSQAMMPLLSLRPLTPVRPRLPLSRKAAYLESVSGCALTTGRGLSGVVRAADTTGTSYQSRPEEGARFPGRIAALRPPADRLLLPRTRSGNGANSSTSSSHNCNTGRGGDCTPSGEDSARPRTQLEMSLIWLQVGQCGNQIGQEWWQILSSNLADADRYPYFSRDGFINAICVDTEPKVIRKLRQQVKRGYFRDSNVIVGQRGRGNNWAYGYQEITSSAEESLLHRTMEAVRREVERRDCYSGAVMLHSLCGGTGSGLGSRLCEEIRDAYPAGYILSVTAAPHDTGDSPLQHYNSLLCLTWMQRFCDGVLLFQNDEVMKRAASFVENKTLPASGLHPSISLTSMNTHIASCLAGLFCPVYSLRTRSSVSVGLEPWELIRCLCPMSTMKFLHTSLVCNRGTASWDKVTSSVVQTIPRADPHGRLHHSLSVLAVARNSQDYPFLLSRDSVLMKLRQAYRCVPWHPSAIQCWTDPQNILDPSCHSHSLTVCANHSSAADLMSGVLSRARAMYNAGAYLHWYRGYGCEDDHFQMSFDTLTSTVEEYRGLGVP